MPLDPAELARMIDHTLLRPDATEAQVRHVCAEAIEHGFWSVCVNPARIRLVAGALSGSGIRACSVVGFPFGATTPEAKATEAAQAVASGASEIDMVIHIGALKDGQFDAVREDIATVRRATQGALLKVIIETCLLDDAQKTAACRLAAEAEADYVKTSTGYGGGGATVADVALMRGVVGDRLGVKASGGIRDFATAEAMVAAGATRIGASTSVAIVTAAASAAQPAGAGYWSVSGTVDGRRRIAVIGSCMVDLVTYVERMPGAGETLAAPRFAMGFGGKGANQAVAAAKLGSDVMMVACVGDDAFGHDTLRNFAAVGVDAKHVRLIAGASSGVAPIFVEPSGENRILIVKGANEALSPAQIDAAAEDLAGCALILLQLEVPLETVYYAIAWGARHGVPVLLNPAPAVASLEIARIRAASFVPNQSELEILTGMPTETQADAEYAARRLVEAGIGRVIVTLGADGALLVEGAKPALHIPPVRVTPVDTTGAGDAFIGAFAHQWVQRGGEMAESLAFAARYAADSITRPGTQKAFATVAEFASFG